MTVNYLNGITNILDIVLSEVVCAVPLPFGAITPVRDLFSGPEVINVKGCQNYFTEKEEHGWGSRKRTDTQTNLKILIMSTSLALIWSRVKVKV